MKTIFAAIVLSLALPSVAGGQDYQRNASQASNPIDRLTPPLPTAAERHVADVASWATALAAVALDTKASFDAPNRGRAFGLQAMRLGITYGAALAVKQMVGRERPCHALYESTNPEACGADGSFSSFYSAHTALAFQTLGGARLQYVLPLALGTGGLRIAAGKHWLTDTLAGAGAGLLTSRIR